MDLRSINRYVQENSAVLDVVATNVTTFPSHRATVILNATRYSTIAVVTMTKHVMQLP